MSIPKIVTAVHAGNETFSILATNKSTEMTGFESFMNRNHIEDKWVQVAFCFLYTSIFVCGLMGNFLVCYVVFRNRAMQTVTNLFITNLAMSDILLCVLAVPFTPMYTFLGQWIFGKLLCHLVPYAQGTSVYVSTLTLTAIAVDRFFVIIYPFRPRMKLFTCFCIIITIWIFSLMATLPYCVYMLQKMQNGRYYCEEYWPTEEFRVVFGFVTALLQFGIPFVAITFCYIKVSLKLNERVRAKPGAKSTKKEEADRERKKRTNRMLIAMVSIFGICWAPLTGINLTNDINSHTGDWKYYYLVFFSTHALAMSSTCYNPFLYAWLNDNFKKEFKQVLPCFKGSRRTQGSQIGARAAGWKSERTCNGNETCQETLLPTSSVANTTGKQNETPPAEMVGVFSRWSEKNHDSVEIMLVAFPSTNERSSIIEQNVADCNVIQSRTEQASCNMIQDVPAVSI